MILNHEPPKLFFLMCRQYKKPANGFRQQLSCHCFPLCNAVDTHRIPSVHEIWTCAPLIFTPRLLFEMKPPINQFCCFKIFSLVFSKGRKNVFCQPLGNKQTKTHTSRPHKSPKIICKNTPVTFKAHILHLHSSFCISVETTIRCKCALQYPSHQTSLLTLFMPTLFPVQT